MATTIRIIVLGFIADLTEEGSNPDVLPVVGRLQLGLGGNCFPMVIFDH